MTETPAVTRRRALAVFGAAAGVALAAAGGRAGAVPLFTWRGSALGAPSRITLAHPDRAAAERLFALCAAEIERLEALFSLHREDSEIARLNRDAALAAPSTDMTRLLAEARRFAALTGGAFDVTVQPLWRLHAEHFARHPGSAGPPEDAVAAALALVDWRAVEVADDRVALARPGMAITLNGIAQGYITDRVADLLRANGIDRVLIDLGETRALGEHPDARPWKIGLVDPFAPETYGEVVELVDRAVATSGSYGTRFSADGRHHHLFAPATGRSANHHASVSVLAASATVADALSTGLYVAPRETAQRVVAKLPGIEVRITDADGSKHRLVG
jgi:thiamine biosynthesis lipoprotein